MTQEQKEKKAAINRLNDRLRQMELRFGVDSAPAKDYRAKMEKLGGEYTLPTGRISKSTKALDSMSMDAIRAMERQKTAGQMLDDWKQYIAAVEKKDTDKISEKDVIDYYKMAHKIREGLDALGDYESDAIRKYRDKYNIQKGKLTYEQLRQAKTEWNKQNYVVREKYHQKRLDRAKKEVKEKYFDHSTPEPAKVTAPRTETTRRNPGRRRG